MKTLVYKDRRMKKEKETEIEIEDFNLEEEVIPRDPNNVGDLFRRIVSRHVRELKRDNL